MANIIYMSLEHGSEVFRLDGFIVDIIEIYFSLSLYCGDIPRILCELSGLCTVALAESQSGSRMDAMSLILKSA
jgi:hypothetical protein